MQMKEFFANERVLQSGRCRRTISKAVAKGYRARRQASAALSDSSVARINLGAQKRGGIRATSGLRPESPGACGGAGYHWLPPVPRHGNTVPRMWLQSTRVLYGALRLPSLVTRSEYSNEVSEMWRGTARLQGYGREGCAPRRITRRRAALHEYWTALQFRCRRIRDLDRVALLPFGGTRRLAGARVLGERVLTNGSFVAP